MNIENPFASYKEKHLGETVVFYGSGPTILSFDPTVVPDNVLKIGTNDQIFLNLDLDYWFMGDAMPQIPSKFYDRFKEYDDFLPKYQKFVRYCNWKDDRDIFVHPWGKVPRNGQLPLNMKNTKYYIADSDGNPSECKFKKDISIGNLSCVASISFEALQFALYAGAKKIFLVGHDSDYTNGTFRGYKIGLSQGAGPCLINYWKLVKIWVSENYPDVEISSINPVGLRGIFPEAKIENIG